MQDIAFALSHIPGQHRLNLHASYAIWEENEKVDRDQIQPHHFRAWVDFARQHHLGLDFNPTLFSHPLAQEATLSSEKEEIRQFWIRHCQQCIKIADYFAQQLSSPCLVNIWIPDGLKDIPANRSAPRAQLKDSLDQILSIDYCRDRVKVAVESKVFGIGLESYTVGSHEFYMNYAQEKKIYCLLDSGHYHPTESIADKISSLLLFSDQIALHVTRSVRWDSDHVVRLDDDTLSIAREIIHAGSEKVMIGLDYFDASINRIAAWIVGVRNMQKALLIGLLTPQKKLDELQQNRQFTELLVLQEELKSYPFGAVWDQFCELNQVASQQTWLHDVMNYEKTILLGRKGEE